MTLDDLPPLPDGFKRTSGKSGPRDGKWYVQIRANGFCDTRIAYEHSQLRWIWDATYPSGDIVAVKRA